MPSDVTVVMTAGQSSNSFEEYFTVAISAPESAVVALTYLHDDVDITDSLSLFLSPYGDTSVVPTILDIPATFFVQKTKDYNSSDAFCLLLEDAEGRIVSRSWF